MYNESNKIIDAGARMLKARAEMEESREEDEEEEFIQPFDNWRDDINRKVRKISQESGIPYQKLFYDMYSDLEQTARCVLSTRQRNKKNRMERSGCTKSDVQKFSRILFENTA